MSDFGAILTLINEALGGPAEDYMLSDASLATVIREGNAAGMSGRSILSQFRAAGGAVANSTFWQLRQEVLSSENAFQDKIALYTNSSDIVQPLIGGAVGKYEYRFRVYLTHDDGSGWPVRSTSEIKMHSWDYDTDRAMEAMGQMVEGSGGDFYDQGQPLGFELTGIYQYAGK